VPYCSAFKVTTNNRLRKQIIETGNIFRNIVELVNINDMICKNVSY